jgi:penicillin-insensitive murein DD-endopeptidase
VDKYRTSAGFLPFCQRRIQDEHFMASAIRLWMGAGLLCGLLWFSACASHGVVGDGTTVSYGRSFNGRLLSGVRLPHRGEGYRVPERWVERGNLYGTDELITMIVRVARRVHRETGQRLGVADLSPPGGGRSRWHRSHQTGRDVDLLLFAVSPRGRPLDADAMVRFTDDGSSRSKDTHGQFHSRRYFDRARNWALIRALLQEPTVDIQIIYIYEPLKHLLLAHARATGEPEALIARADATMAQPLDSSKHNDHIHVRIACPASDRALGCRDRAEVTPAERHMQFQQTLVRASAPLVRAVLRLARLSL